MRIGSFGGLIFRVDDERVLTFRDMQRTVSAEWDTVNRIAGKPLSIFSGAALQQISMTVILDATLGIPPRKMLQEIETMVENGSAYPLLVGNKQIGSSYWVITKSTESWKTILTKGKLLRAEVSLTFQEYVKQEEAGENL